MDKNKEISKKLDEEIAKLKIAISKTKRENEITKLRIKKKALLLQKKSE